MNQVIKFWRAAVKTGSKQLPGYKTVNNHGSNVVEFIKTNFRTMPPKRGKSGERKGGQDGDSAWEAKLVNTVFSEEIEVSINIKLGTYLHDKLLKDGWTATIAFIIGSRHEDYGIINVIDETIRSKSRRLFSNFSKSELYNEVCTI